MTKSDECRDALQLATAYIAYVKERGVDLHAEADGTPSIEAAILETLQLLPEGSRT